MGQVETQEGKEIMNSVVMNSVGLLFDIGGVILVFIYGLSPIIVPSGHQLLATADIDQDEIRKARQYRKYSRIGLALIVLGFCLQLVGNFMIK